MERGGSAEPQRVLAESEDIIMWTGELHSWTLLNGTEGTDCLLTKTKKYCACLRELRLLSSSGASVIFITAVEMFPDFVLES